MQSELLNKIRDLALPIIEKNKLVLYSIKEVQDYGVDVIQIMVDDPNTFDIDIDVVASINQEVLDLVNDDLPDGSYLEVTSVGIEREINIPVDLEKSLNKYIFCSLYEKHPVLNEKEIYGTLLSFDDEKLTLEVKIKTRKKIVEIEIKKIAKARLAVEF